MLEEFVYEDFEDMFDFEDITPKSKKTNRYKKPKVDNGLSPYKVKYKNAIKFCKDNSEAILAGEKLYCLVTGDFIFGDIAEEFIISNNLENVEMSISTLSLSKENVDSLHNCIPRLKSLDLLASAYFFAHNRQNIKYIYEKLDIDNKFQLSICSSHTKEILLNVNGKKIVFHGSANLRSSACVEFFTVETNPELYDFLKEYHDGVKAQYATINKDISNPIKRKPLRKREPDVLKN